jgi:hypothetical protein
MENDFLITVKTHNGLLSFWQKELCFMETQIAEPFKTRIKLKGYDKFIYSTEYIDDINQRIKIIINNK